VKRREFITLLSGAVAAWPLAANAQQARMPIIGFLGSGTMGSRQAEIAAFHQGLKEAGYVEGETIAIETRWAEGRYERLPALAADLVQRRVAVLVAIGPPAAQAAKTATTTIPIVFTVGPDPVNLGLVASLSRPGGNLTGINSLLNVVAPKQLEVLHELLPQVATIGVLANPGMPSIETDTSDLQTAARALGLQLVVQSAKTASEIDAAFATFVSRQSGGLVVISDPFYADRRQQLVAQAARYALPTVFFLRDFPADGGLMSYGGSNSDAYRQVAIYTGKILKGATPADLPVQLGVRVELVINLKTAKALGIDVPRTLIARADEVIE
jgi:putative tryptophan/tyrosine transport system substrate-binding protein